MSKRFIVAAAGVFVLAFGTALAQTTTPNSTVTSGSALYTIELERVYDPTPAFLIYPQSYSLRTCNGATCNSESGPYTFDTALRITTSLQCQNAALAAGIQAGEAFTCALSMHSFGHTCVPQPGDPPNICNDGGFVNPIGFVPITLFRSGKFVDLNTIRIFRGTQIASDGCEPFPTSRWSSVDTQGWVNPPRYPAVRSTECSTTVFPGNEPQLPLAQLTASPSAITTGGSSALAYACSNNATSASINNGVGTLASPTAGTVPVSPTTTTAYTLTCTNAAGTGTASATVTVTPAPTVVDLTTSAITPTSATAGTPVNLSATATNIGTAPSGAFPLLFQIQSPAQLMSSGYLTSLVPSTSAPASVSHTFPAAGTYQVRACANFNTSWQAITTESDYANNCGPWTPVTVAAAPASPSLSCTVSTQTPAVGDTVTYTASGASAPFTWTSSDNISFGSAQTAVRTFTAQGQYGMTLAKSGFTSAECPIVTAGTAPCVNPTGTITATPNRIRPGTTVSLSYSASGIQGSCTITGPTVSQTIPASSCVVPSGSVTTGPLTTQSTFILTCDGTERTRTVVNVVPQFEEF